MISISILEDDDILQPTDYCRPLLLTTLSIHSDTYSCTNTYSGLPENNVKWLRVDQYFGPIWYGKKVSALLAKLPPHEFIRGDVPLSHRFGKTRTDIDAEYQEYLETNVMQYGKYAEYTFEELRFKDRSYYDWALGKGIIKDVSYDNY